MIIDIIHEKLLLFDIISLHTFWIVSATCSPNVLEYTYKQITLCALTFYTLTGVLFLVISRVSISPVYYQNPFFKCYMFPQLMNSFSNKIAPP